MNTALPEGVMARINAIGLDPIKIKLMDPKEGKGWDRTKVDQIEVEYRRFLFLSVTESSPIVPTTDIDAFWHQHILDTRKYAEDCETALGSFLHHFPYFGMRGEQDAQNLADSFVETQQIYQRVFGEVYSVSKDETDCTSCGAGSCGGPGCVGAACSGISDNVRQQIMRPSERPTFVAVN
jgi:hypothetical protein